MKTKIECVKAMEILDSRGNPTVRVFCRLDNSVNVSASVPSGASTGENEAVELRDADKKRYGGKGVLNAVANVNKTIGPRLQGMKLTAWELAQDGIPVTVIADNMAGVLMSQGKVECVIVGADRIAANGDTANKIGTYSLAVLAKVHAVPFYVAAPCSTIDASLENGGLIPIEERSHDEMTHIDGVRIAPEGVEVINPAFDVTPAAIISGIITEKGVVYPPFERKLKDKS